MKTVAVLLPKGIVIGRVKNIAPEMLTLEKPVIMMEVMDGIGRIGLIPILPPLISGDEIRFVGTYTYYEVEEVEYERARREAEDQATIAKAEAANIKVARGVVIPPGKNPKM